MAFALSTLHSKALRHLEHARGKLERHRETAKGLVTTTARSALTVGGGASGALIDHYMGNKADALPEAKLGPAPVVLTAALVGKAIGLAMGGTEGSFLQDYANGLGAYGTGVELIRVLKSMPASK